MHRTGTQLASDARGAFTVACLQVSSQSVRGIVSNGNRVSFVLKGYNRQDRAENFLAGDPHVIGDIGENRRSHEPPGRQPFGATQSACDQLRFFVDTHLNHGLHPVELNLIKQRAQVVPLEFRIIDSSLFSSALRNLNGLVITAAFDQKPRWRITRLTRIEHALRNRLGNPTFQITISKNQIR